MPADAAPAIRFEAAPRPIEPSPLRSDVAGFLGRTRRGPVGTVERVEEWREFARRFGGLASDADTTYALRSYFENGGEVAYVIRLAGRTWSTAEATWPEAGELPTHHAFTADGGAVTSFTLRATSPGEWADGGSISLRYKGDGASGGPELDVDVRIQGENHELLRGLPASTAAELGAAVAARSQLIRLDFDPANVAPPAALAGPARLSWRVAFAGGHVDPPDRTAYLDAVAALGLEREVALVALPDLHGDLPQDEVGEVVRLTVDEAERRHDRLVLIDLPPDATDVGEVLAAADGLDVAGSGVAWRSAAAYHPPVWVQDPLGGASDPLRRLPASGPVAGLVSRLDRERGAHHTPANAPLRDAVDLTAGYDEVARGRLNERGVNVLRCFSGRGLKVWGGRTLDPEPLGRFVAHRRLIHRLVRAIRRVAEPLVFEVNGPELWLTFTRAVTSILLEAYRAGALQGSRPKEAFRVQCDEATNPPEEIDLGRVVCEIAVAPAVPMEFITLRVALGREGELEVFEP